LVAARFVAWVKNLPGQQKTLYRVEFLAQMPPAIHAFAAHGSQAVRLENTAVKDEAAGASRA